MRVADIFSQAKDFLGTGASDPAVVYLAITDALELLNNKAPWDVLKAYLDLPVQAGNLVTLPDFVDVPIKVNVSNEPSFSRDRIYEFSINGPGSATRRATFGWEDRGFVPTLVTLPAASRLLIPINGGDFGKKVVIQGRDAAGKEITETLVNAATDVATLQTFYAITAVSKDATTNSVPLWASSNGVAHTTLLATYRPAETEPRYRQIRLSEAGATVRMLVRRKSLAVSGMDDFIQVQSKVGMLLMIKAIVAWRRTDSAVAQAFEADATRICTEAQKATNTFVDLAKDTEADSARGLNLNNRDSVVMGDVFDEVAAIVGPMGQQRIFEKVTEGLEALCNKGHWDGLTGYVDIFTDCASYLTLPRYVESPIEINLGGRPTYMRNKWFEFHLNGPGSECQERCGGWEWVGDVCLQHPVNFVMQLVAVPDTSADDGKVVTVYGYDENAKWIRTGGEDGFPLVTSHSKILPVGADQKVSRVERITREATAGFVRLTGYSLDQTQSVQLGYYYPDETEPRYMRIKLPRASSWVRMRYRKRTLKVASLADPLHLKSKLSIVCMVRALDQLYKAKTGDEIAAAGALELKAVGYLADEQSSSNPGETFQIQFDKSWGSNYILV